MEKEKRENNRKAWKIENTIYIPVDNQKWRQVYTNELYSRDSLKKLRRDARSKDIEIIEIPGGKNSGTTYERYGGIIPPIDDLYDFPSTRTEKLPKRVSRESIIFTATLIGRNTHKTLSYSTQKLRKLHDSIPNTLAFLVEREVLRKVKKGRALLYNSRYEVLIEPSQINDWKIKRKYEQGIRRMKDYVFPETPLTTESQKIVDKLKLREPDEKYRRMNISSIEKAISYAKLRHKKRRSSIILLE